MTKPDNELTWRDLEIGAICTSPGNTRLYKTGDWRSQKPVYYEERCIKCGMCLLYCPEGCIVRDETGNYVADLYYCKGCGICAKECPVYAVEMVEESE